MGTIFIIGFVVFLVLTFTAALIASEREIGWGAILLACIVFTPIVGLLVAFASKRKKDTEYEKRVIELLEKLNAK